MSHLEQVRDTYGENNPHRASLGAANPEINGGNGQSIFSYTQELQELLDWVGNEPLNMLDLMNNPEMLARAGQKFRDERWAYSGLSERATEIAQDGGRVKCMVLGSGSDGFLEQIRDMWLNNISPVEGHGGFKVYLSELSPEQIEDLEKYRKTIFENENYPESERPKFKRITTNDFRRGYSSEYNFQPGNAFKEDSSFEIVILEGDMKDSIEIMIENGQSANEIICPESIFHTGPRDVLPGEEVEEGFRPLMPLIMEIVDPEHGLEFSTYEFILRGGEKINHLANRVTQNPQLSGKILGVLDLLGFKGYKEILQGFIDQYITFMTPDEYEASIANNLQEGFIFEKSNREYLDEDFQFTCDVVATLAEGIASIFEEGIEYQVFTPETIARFNESGFDEEVARRTQLQWGKGKNKSSYFHYKASIRPDSIAAY